MALRDAYLSQIVMQIIEIIQEEINGGKHDPTKSPVAPLPSIEDAQDHNLDLAFPIISISVVTFIMVLCFVFRMLASHYGTMENRCGRILYRIDKTLRFAVL